MKRVKPAQCVEPQGHSPSHPTSRPSGATSRPNVGGFVHGHSPWLSAAGVKLISAAILSLALVFSIPGVVCASDALPSPPPQSEMPIVLWQATQLAAVSGAESSAASSSDSIPSREEESWDSTEEEAGINQSIADPLEPVNRAFYHFNDKLYFWVLKPVATGYKFFFDEELRISIRNFFSNVATPVRVGNCLLQGEFKGAGNEIARFGINTTFGFFGFIDQGKDKFQIDKQDRNFGQTLGIWGFGPGVYVNWPILGPSSLRDTAGFVGDIFLDPRTYLLESVFSIIVRPVELINDTSLTIGDYEAIKNAALDPYVALRDGYYQYRENKIKKK